MEPIILASASPRRRELLSQIGVPFKIQVSEIDEENLQPEGSPAEKAEKLALFKAMAVAERVNKGLVLGVDTIVVLDDEIFGKPQNDEDAFQMLTKLSGKDHLVISGIAVVKAESGFFKVAHETTEVSFATLSSDEIKAYIDTGEPRGKAGAYAIQGIGALFVEKISGCYSNVVGLPLMRFRRLLEEFGVSFPSIFLVVKSFT